MTNQQGWTGERVGEPLLLVDAHFRNRATTTDDERRSGAREYPVCASADPVEGALQTVEAEPRVLPFPRRPTLASKVARLIGMPLNLLRKALLDRLRGTAGCTHLDDALQALAERPRSFATLSPTMSAAK